MSYTGDTLFTVYFPCVFTDNPVSDGAIRHVALVVHLQKQTKYMKPFCTLSGEDTVHPNAVCFVVFVFDTAIAPYL